MGVGRWHLVDSALYTGANTTAGSQTQCARRNPMTTVAAAWDSVDQLVPPPPLLFEMGGNGGSVQEEALCFEHHTTHVPSRPFLNSDDASQGLDTQHAGRRQAPSTAPGVCPDHTVRRLVTPLTHHHNRNRTLHHIQSHPGRCLSPPHPLKTAMNHLQETSSVCPVAAL